MKLYFLLLFICLTFQSISNSAEEIQKASEMPNSVSEPASLSAKKRALKKVKKRKQELLKKLKNNDSADSISNAKTRLQIDRIESNRQDYLNQENNKPENVQPSE
jgi:hypothetical protein